MPVDCLHIFLNFPLHWLHSQIGLYLMVPRWLPEGPAFHPALSATGGEVIFLSEVLPLLKT